MDRRAAKDAVFAQLSLFKDAPPAPVAGARRIRLAGRLLEYRFFRRRRRSLGITVDAGGIVVSAPLRTPWREIEAFILEKEGWIIEKLQHWARVPPPAILRGETGESLPLLGAPMTLEVRGGRGARGVIRQESERIVVCVREPERSAAVLAPLVGWLKQRALEAFAPRVEHYATRLGLAPPRLALSSARSQWGVCMEGGSIRLNWRLVHLQPPLADYVVAHEVAHLVEFNHSKRFWRVLESLYPGWREARERLELAGAALPILRRPR
jgi:predicted metal-dependent hydrolase